jgi:hypothetical protein
LPDRVHNRGVSDAGEFIDSALQYEGDWYRADAERERLNSTLEFYGASIGAIRGTVRDASRKFPGMSHDDITSLSSELWRNPVYERRLAAVVLLQSHVQLLKASDLTRIEGFLRTATLAELVDPLSRDVITPLVSGLDPASRSRAQAVIDRWAIDGDPWLARASTLVSGALSSTPSG